MSELIDRKEAAARLKIGIVTLDRLRKAGKIPYLQIGALIRFTAEGIEECIENLKVSTEAAKHG
jgi:excisionase family DNA binding protein